MGQLGTGQLGTGQLGMGQLWTGHLGMGQLGMGQLGMPCWIPGSCGCSRPEETACAAQLSYKSHPMSNYLQRSMVGIEYILKTNPRARDQTAESPVRNSIKKEHDQYASTSIHPHQCLREG